MLDDTTQTQPTTDVTASSSDMANTGGVLGSDPGVTTPTASPAIDSDMPITAPAATDTPAFNTSPVDSPLPADPVASPSDITEPAVTTDQTTTTPSAPAPSSDLMALKQQALQSLSPLLDKLDQTPEEKFRTTMMMIQASDDQALIQTAYESANQITDEKARAQALLDVVNEINYFTQQPKNDS